MKQGRERKVDEAKGVALISKQKPNQNGRMRPRI